MEQSTWITVQDLNIGDHVTFNTNYLVGTKIVLGIERIRWGKIRLKLRHILHRQMRGGSFLQSFDPGKLVCRLDVSDTDNKEMLDDSDNNREEEIVNG